MKYLEKYIFDILPDITLIDNFPEDINVVMMAPKGMGPSVRKLYLQGNGINSSIAVEQDVDNRATDRVISWAIASGSPYVFETSMEKEYISDLFGERAILLGGIHAMVEYLYKMFNQNFTKEIANSLYLILKRP